MAAIPPQPRPPEAQLIRDRRIQLGLSIRQAAAIAGNSEGGWRLIEKPGRRSRPAGTVALMARAVQVTPEELNITGKRPDAAEAMAALPPPPSTQNLLSELREHMQRIQEIVGLLDD